MDMLEFQSRIKDLISIHDTVYVVLKSTEVPGVKNITTDSVVAVCNWKKLHYPNCLLLHNTTHFQFEEQYIPVLQLQTYNFHRLLR